MLRFIAYAVPLLILLLALFGFTVELLDAEPREGSVIRLALFEQPRVPGQLVIGTWLVEASGLIALFLLAQGRFGSWWLDGLVAGWLGWVFRGPLLVITIVVAARQPQEPWWRLAFGWWVLYSVCGLSLAFLARRSGLASWTTDDTVEVESKGLHAGMDEPQVEQGSSEGESTETMVENDEHSADGRPEAEAAPEGVETEDPEPATDSEQIESEQEPGPEEAAMPGAEVAEGPAAETTGSSTSGDATTADTAAGKD